MSILIIVWDFVHKSHLIHLIQVLDLPRNMSNINSIYLTYVYCNPCFGIIPRRRTVILIYFEYVISEKRHAQN